MEHCEAELEGNPEPHRSRSVEVHAIPARAGPRFVAFRNLRTYPLIKPSLARQFELEAQSRAIQGCTDMEELRGVAMSLLKAWHMQAEMTKHFGAQAMGQPARIKS